MLDLPWVGDVRGKGLLAVVELVADKKTKEPLPEATVAKVASAMAAKGVLVGRTNRSLPGFNNIINFAPPYVVTASDVGDIAGTFGEAIRETLGA